MIIHSSATTTTFFSWNTRQMHGENSLCLEAWLNSGKPPLTTRTYSSFKDTKCYSLLLSELNSRWFSPKTDYSQFSNVNNILRLQLKLAPASVLQLPLPFLMIDVSGYVHGHGRSTPWSINDLTKYVSTPPAHRYAAGAPNFITRQLHN
jgi:hypothetical protein